MEAENFKDVYEPIFICTGATYIFANEDYVN